MFLFHLQIQPRTIGTSSLYIFIQKLCEMTVKGLLIEDPRASELMVRGFSQSLDVKVEFQKLADDFLRFAEQLACGELYE